MTKTILAILLSATTGMPAASAQPRPAPSTSAPVVNWPREPVSFLSLPLGGPMRDAAMPCPPALPNENREASTVVTDGAAPCWTGEGNVKNVYNLPSPGFALERVTAVTYRDQIGSVIVVGMRPQFGQMKRYLLDRFGPPTVAEAKPVGEPDGLRFRVETLIWEGERVSARLDEIHTRVDTFRLIVLHKASTLHTPLFDAQ